jgi:guanylate kinase
MTSPLFLFVGPSASGKTSVADALEKFGYTQLKSYTTRIPRYDGENNHIFVTKEEFDKLENKIAYTEYNDNFYCATKDQLDQVNIYVVDISGVHTLLENYGNQRKIYILYFDASVKTRIERMVERGDTDTAIVSRLRVDEEYDWYDQLYILVDYFKTFKNKKIYLEKFDANQDFKDVINEVVNVINYLGG